ncbi:MAG: hypothetical protein GX440_00360 [Propionibacterium sp.]|nr:hypothetical protein [Propionibacterium sp.]
MGPMKLTVPIAEDGQIDSRFGRAARMAVGTVTDDGQLTDWQVYEVGWDVLHDQSEHGQHHARVVRFLKDNQVDRVIFVQAGQSMLHTIDKMGLLMVQAPVMDAKDAVIQAAALQEG